MTSKIKYGIRFQLLLLLLLLTLPFLAQIGVSYVREAEAGRAQAAQRMLAAARITAARLDDHVSDIRQVLMVLTPVIASHVDDVPANNQLLRSMAGQLPPHINDISVWNAAGDNVGSLNPPPERRLRNIANLPAFKAAMLGRELNVDAPLVSPINGARIAVFSMPVSVDGVVAGVLTASTRLDQLQQLLAPESSLPEGAVITVSDDRGILLARSADPEKWIGTDQSQFSYFKLALGQREGTGEGPGVGGVLMTAGFTMSLRLPWLVYAAAPSETLLVELQRRTETSLLIGLGILIVGAIAATWVGNRIARPLRQLCVDATAIGMGHLAHRSEVKDASEVGLLAETLNRMAAALGERSELLQRSQEQLRQITDNVPALVAYIDADERFVFANRTFRDWLGMDPQTLQGRSLKDLFGPTYEGFADHIHAALRGERVVTERQLDTVRGPKFVHLTMVPLVASDGRITGLNVLGNDITQRKITEEQLRHRAEFDLLTGLANRGLFLDRLKQGMAEVETTGRPLALLLLDVDYFKAVNDRLGHAAGDDLLRLFSRRLQDAVRPTDTVARLSGDEFAIILRDVDGMAAAALVADKVVHAIRVPMLVGNENMQVTTSIGVALCLPGDRDGAQLMARADAALYDAKRRGRDGYFCEDARVGS